MDPYGEHGQSDKKRILFIIAAIIVFLLVVGIAVASALGGDSRQSGSVTTTSDSETSDDPLQQGLIELDAALKQAASDQTAVKKALESQQSSIVPQGTQDELVRELDDRAAALRQTQEKLAADILLEKEKLVVSNSQSVAAQATLTNTIEVSPALKTKSKKLVEKYAAELVSLKQQVAAANETTLPALAKKVTDQKQIDQLVTVQGLTLKSVESMTAVYDEIVSLHNKLNARAVALKECAEGNEEKCEGLNIGNGARASDIMTQLDNGMSFIASINSTLTATLTLQSTATSTLETLGASGASSAQSSLTAILTQLQMASGMASSLQESLKNTADI